MIKISELFEQTSYINLAIMLQLTNNISSNTLHISHEKDNLWSVQYWKSNGK
jgi:hypothetical protein